MNNLPIYIIEEDPNFFGSKKLVPQSVKQLSESDVISDIYSLPNELFKLITLVNHTTHIFIIGLHRVFDTHYVFFAQGESFFHKFLILNSCEIVGVALLGTTGRERVAFQWCGLEVILELVLFS
ncbi:hypothetical protein POM88_047450 [Heracleum sosnowskyi]|uniref:Uncharacterized protein n=1 Tax=Heracleum sosnowskyi TaxID=360622 RepID=A0AAD8GTX3_9APIA|nr:hypothetical protein POM88_047450 [Heracleum sosnowskyi]